MTSINLNFKQKLTSHLSRFTIKSYLLYTKWLFTFVCAYFIAYYFCLVHQPYCLSFKPHIILILNNKKR